MIRDSYKALLILLIFTLGSCWPSSVSFIDGSMPEEWKSFHLNVLENNAGNTPLSYPLDLAEAIRSGIQNNTKLQLNDSAENAEIDIDGVIKSYSITPVALQEGDNAAKNRLTVSADFTFYIKAPEEDEMRLSTSRFIDYDANTDLSTVENELLQEVTDQIVQDIINKLRSNW